MLLGLVAVVAVGSLTFLGKAVFNTSTNVATNLKTLGGQEVAPLFTDGTGAGPAYPNGAASFVADSTTDSYTFTASGVPAVKFSASGLPAGVSLSSAGVLTDTGTDAYTPPGTPDVFTVTASNGVVPTPAQTFSLTITANPHAPLFTTANSATFTADTSTDKFTFSASGTDPITFTAAAGGPDPEWTIPGITFNSLGTNSAYLTDTGSDAIGVYTFIVTASNGFSPNATQTFTLTVSGVAPAFTDGNGSAPYPTGSATFTAATSTESYQFTANGEPAATFAESATGPGQSFPAGVSLSSSGLLTDTGTDVAGVYTFTVTASNTVTPNATQTFTLTITGAQAPAFTNGDLFDGYATGTTTFAPGSTTATYTFTASGDPAPTFSATGLPTDVSLSSGGVLTDNGQPAGGPYTITVTAQNGVNPSATQTFTLTIANVAPAFTDGNFFPFPEYSTGATTFAPGSTTASYTFTASGAPAPTFTATGLPADLSLSSGGVLTDNGQPAGGPYTITVTAKNGNSPNATQTFTLTIASVAPAFTDGNFFPFPEYSTADTNFNPYSAADSYTFTASGAPTPTFSATALPTGIDLSSSGVLTDDGTDAPGTFTFTVTAQNLVTPNATQAFTLTIGTAPAFTNGDAYDGYATGTTTFTEGLTTNSYTFTASGDPAPTFSATGLPTGILLSSSGVLTDPSGTVVGGPYHITVTATNAVTPNATQAFTLTMHPQQAPAFTNGNYNPAPHYSTGATTFPGTGSGGTYTFTASGDPTPTFTATTPSGVTLSSAGVLTDAGATAGTYTFPVTASNNVNPNATQTFTLSIGTAPAFTNGNYNPYPPFSTGAANFHATGTGSTYTFTASGDPAPTFTAPTPTGIALSSAGVLTENGSQLPGTYTFTVTATNVLGTDTQAFTLTIGTAPAFTNGNYNPYPPFSTGAANFHATGTGSTYTFTASGDPAPTFTAPTPTGIVLSSAGVLTENGSQLPGTYTFTVTAQNGVTPNDTQTFTLTIGIAPAITSVNHAHFNPNSSADSFTVTATGDPAPTFTASAAGFGQQWPIGGVSLSSAGVLTDTGTDAAGTYTFTITAANGVTPNDTQTFTLTIGTAPAITSANHATFTADSSADSFTITTTGNPAATITAAAAGFGQTWPITGITLTNGVLKDTGTDLPGTYTFTITAANGVNPDATQTFTLTVTGTAPAITSANHATFAPHSNADSFTITTTGNPAATITAAAHGGGQTWPITGITLTNGVLKDNGFDAAGTYTFTITAANGVNPNATQTFTLTVT